MKRALVFFTLITGIMLFGDVFTFHKWEVDRTGGEDLLGVCKVDSDNVWAVGKSGTILHRDGTGWSSVSISGITQVNYDFYGVDFPDANTGFIVGENPATHTGIFLKTTDGGATWINKTSQDIIGKDMPFYDVKFGSHLVIGYIATSEATILKSTDGGNNWEIKNLNGVYNDISLSNCFRRLWISRDKPNILWAVSDNEGWIVKTGNGGLTWPVRVKIPYTYKDMEKIIARGK